MRISIIAVGKVREKYLQQGISEYLKRLGPFARMEMIEIGDEPIPDNAAAKEEAAVKEKEGEKILRQMRPGSFTIVLDPRGEQMTSEGLAAYLERLGNSGRSDVNFVIGGSLGLSPAVRQAADFTLSFSQFTFPHQLMRLILMEQIYRAFKIMRGEKYHK